jgi:hypothetical protein
MNDIGNLPSAVGNFLDKRYSGTIVSKVKQKPKYMYGYRIISIQKNSPVANAKGSKEPISPYHDLIVGVLGEKLNHRKCQPNEGPLHSAVAAHKDKEMTLTIYNSTTQTLREMSIVPNNNWGGNGLLGVVCRFDPVDPLSVLLPV